MHKENDQKYCIVAVISVNCKVYNIHVLWKHYFRIVQKKKIKKNLW